MASAGAGDENLGRTAEGLVMIGSEDMPAGTPIVKGPDFNHPQDLDKLMDSFATIGFQATNLALAIEEVRKMLTWRLSDDPINAGEDEEWHDPAKRAATKCTVWLAFTSNMVSCGAREIIRWLVEHKYVDVIVTTGGAVEEDIMKCLRPHFMGDFYLKGADLRMRGINRIGNLLVPNLSYVAFEEWFLPLVEELHEEQEARLKASMADRDSKEASEVFLTPSGLIERMGKRIDNPESIWYWAAKHGIPVFCPGITDGSIGDMLYFHLWKRGGFVLDVARDVRRINDISVRAKKSGVLVLGGGLPKHHVCNANLMRNGADFAVFINTGVDWDGSDSGARPDEAVSWGKIKLTANPVKVCADATLVFPLLVAQTFVRYHKEQQEKAAAAAAKPAEGAGAGAGAGGK